MTGETTLPAVLTDPAVDVVDLRTTVDPGSFENRRAAVADARNRAVAAAVRDDDGRLLLARSGDDWRLPGTSVGAVVDFVGELRAAVEREHDVALSGVKPRWVYRQTAEYDGVGAPLYYVVCEASLERPRPSVDADAALRWVRSPPDRLRNPTVVKDVVGE
jgi:hypothetical protein